MIVKKCSSCQNWFPSELKSHIHYCVSCFPSKKDSILEGLKKSRFIDTSNFDVWDDSFPYEKSIYGIERVCRVCGCRLLRKNGTYSSTRRQCNKHTGIYLAGKFTWNWVRFEYIKLFRKKHEVEISCRYLDEKGEFRYSSRNYFLCEDCGILVYSDNIEVHHIVPVHTLTWENRYLIWDFANLKILCIPCHKKVDHQLKKKPVVIKKTKQELLEEKYQNYKKITSFLK